MTLRLRLTLALVALATVGLGVFGFVTYTLYARSQYQRLDEQLRGVVLPVNGFLNRSAGLDAGPGGPGFPVSGTGNGTGTGTGTGNGNGNGTGNGTGTSNGTGSGTSVTGLPPNSQGFPFDVWATLLDGNGAALATLTPGSEVSPPQLPATLTRSAQPITLPAQDGSLEWRVWVAASDRHPTETVVVAVPLSGVRSSLDQLVLIETIAAVTLLLVLGTGSWLILRHGLTPLEHMAGTAEVITAGDLSQRVQPADHRTEVGELGLALNTMLDQIEAAFAEREATERRLRQFLADASHELRTPLTSIQGFAELFRLDEQRDTLDLDVILRRIEEESARMKGLVEDLLLLARLDETRPFEPTAVDLGVLAADACSDAVAQDPSRPVTLDAPDPLVVLGDRDHLFQAITNLVANAVRHTPSGTPLEVSAHLEQGAAVVRVRDHGPGLDPDALGRVFDRFWQADRARVGTGSGLGLAIVAAIAAEHGGTAAVANAPDGGAEFTLRLPLSPADRPPAAPDGSESTPRRG